MARSITSPPDRPRLIRKAVGLAARAALVMAPAALAQAPAGTDREAELWAASCMACHGTDGRADGVALTIADRSEAELAAALLAFKAGERRATVMHQHTRGYSDEELRRIARWFANRRPVVRRP